MAKDPKTKADEDAELTEGEKLDEGLDETFPASDPPAATREEHAHDKKDGKR